MSLFHFSHIWKLCSLFQHLTRMFSWQKLMFWNFLSQLTLEIPLSGTNYLLPVLNLAPNWVLVVLRGPTISPEAKSEGSCPPLSSFSPSDSSSYPAFSGHTCWSFKKSKKVFSRTTGMEAEALLKLIKNKNSLMCMCFSRCQILDSHYLI